MTRIIIEADTDVNARNAQGFTPIQVAARRGSAASLRTLLDCHADTGVQDDDGRCLLSLAVVHGHASVLVALLGQEGARRPVRR